MAGMASACLGSTLAVASATGSNPFAFAASGVTAVAAQYPDTEGQPDQGGVLGDRDEGGPNRDRDRDNRGRARDRRGAGGGSVPGEAQGTRQLGLGGGELPFTGIAAFLLLGAGIVLFGSGTAMRRALRDPRYRLN